MELRSFALLTFDCYGTLIDWEAGILAAMRPILAAHGVSIEDNRLLEIYASLESEAEAGEYRPYRSILSEVVAGFGRRLGFEPSEGERRALAASVASWPAFPDTVAALGALKERFKLAIVSNVDTDLFAGTARHLGVAFDHVITAGEVGAYKPAEAMFRAVLEQSGLPRERILHVAQSLYHDIVPARKLGVATVWVNRRSGRAGAGATPPAEATPDLEVPDLRSLVAHFTPG